MSGAHGGADGQGPSERQIQKRITDGVTRIIGNRAVIDQAKGMLMLLHGIDADQAFKLLQWQSQDNNVKLRDLAAQVIADYQAVTDGQVAPTEVYDRLFLSAHTRLMRQMGQSETDPPSVSQ